MEDDLRVLYQELILDHSRHPRGAGELEHSTHQALGHNPLCGDKIRVFVALDEENARIKTVKFISDGCAISTASASMMSEALEGKTTKEAEALFSAFHKLLTEEFTDSGLNDFPDDVEKLSALAGVRAFPMRVKCATLPWHTFHAALENSSETIKTEDEERQNALPAK
jgi:nitrogen fixation NifU-like protein